MMNQPIKPEIQCVYMKIEIVETISFDMDFQCDPDENCQPNNNCGPNECGPRYEGSAN